MNTREYTVQLYRRLKQHSSALVEAEAGYHRTKYQSTQPQRLVSISVLRSSYTTHPLPSRRLCIPFPPLHHLRGLAALQVLRAHQPARKQVDHHYHLIPSSCFPSQLRISWYLSPARALTNCNSTFRPKMRPVQLIPHH